ncbi:2,3-bisphosphoglycerate-independent phosphoglycerate mutase [Rhabdothermincola sediminis]|uniref:2,3-bisphosphoglycerate-independent phosphoglycerate mutase n=1 Tax=Rhabdothermincola sediminis TaxID=2751370 RepID=UPI001AA058F9|nr:2,3-bisphosphoglycerate-independent phosphoglycerate mutase [Rhabdothermincola sediminis]
MKYVVCVPDGCADEPVDALDGRTPLEVADMPTLRSLAARGELGRAAVIPPGLPPGSDVGNMSIFGYDPARYHTGRAPIEAAALNLKLGPDQVAYRCNLVTIGADGTMVDFAGGHPSSDEARKVIEALDDELGGSGLEFHAGVEYRHIMVAPAAWSDATCIPPHDLTDKPAVGPTGPAAPDLQAVMEASRRIVGRFGLEANQVWLWGQGFQPQMPPFTERFGLDAALCSAVDLVRGLGVLTGIEVVDVEGMTPGYDTDYAAQRECALDALADGADLFIIHIEATDEAGHAGDVEEKVRSLERWDSLVLGDLVDGLDRLGSWRLLLLPDHATPLRLKTHTPDPVPYLLVDSVRPGPGGTYSERAVAGLPAVPGHELMPRLVGL